MGTRIRDWLSSRPYWMRLAISTALGAVAALSLPPVYLVPVLLPALVGLYWLVRTSARPRAALFLGWMFGFGYFIAGLYWIGNAFMVHAARHALFAVPAVLGLCVFLASYTALACWVHRRVVQIPAAGIGGVLIFAALWGVAEWLRSWVFTGFPWNMLGSVWAFSDAMVQPAAVVGTYGLSMITVLMFSYPATMTEQPRATGIVKWLPVLVLLVVPGLMWGAGSIRLAGAETTFQPNVLMRIVQPNIPQDRKWQPDLRSGHVLRQLDMSLNGQTESSNRPTHVIWAETAVPFVLSQDPALLSVLARGAPENGVLITGSLRSNAGSGADEGPSFWNSLFAIDGAGDVVATYDKAHLVPFGEYIPYKNLLPFEKLTTGAGEFTPGTGQVVMTVPGLPPFSPLICYEVIFPGAVVPDGERPEWMLNLTNDAWYGLSSGPFQHLVSTRLRAVEEGLPVVRVANTGISAVIDGYGREVKTLGLGEAGILDARLPNAVSPTYYANHPVLALLLVIMVLFGAGLFLVCKRERHQDTSS